MTAGEAIAGATRRLENAGIAGADAPTEARLLAQFAFDISREVLQMYSDRTVSKGDLARFENLVARREKREPLAYLTGTREFYGLSFAVSPDVLIPRPETEFVVEAVLHHLEKYPDARFADVGTGSGALAVAVAANTPSGVSGFASDLSEVALALARQNARTLGVAGRIMFACGDLLTPLFPFAPFAVIASNPPYIAPQEIDALAPEVRDYEPRIALGQNPDALHFYRRLARDAPPLLASGGLLVVEVGHKQSDAVAELWREANLDNIAIIKDYAGIGRIVSGRKSALPAPNV